jgi:hypothetical protein
VNRVLAHGFRPRALLSGDLCEQTLEQPGDARPLIEEGAAVAARLPPAKRRGQRVQGSALIRQGGVRECAQDLDGHAAAVPAVGLGLPKRPVQQRQALIGLSLREAHASDGQQRWLGGQASRKRGRQRLSGIGPGGSLAHDAAGNGQPYSHGPAEVEWTGDRNFFLGPDQQLIGASIVTTGVPEPGQTGHGTNHDPLAGSGPSEGHGTREVLVGLVELVALVGQPTQSEVGRAHGRQTQGVLPAGDRLVVGCARLVEPPACDLQVTQVAQRGEPRLPVRAGQAKTIALVWVVLQVSGSAAPTLRLFNRFR